ncbi:preprotein translocase subunit SecG [bacterium]|nr:preprotein translocase subunit SecG [bacterium]
MAAFLSVIHVLVALFLIVSIMLQSSKGGGLAGMFGGGGGSGAVFGGRGAGSFLAKVTMWLGITFAVTSLVIALFSKQIQREPESALKKVLSEQQTASPASMLPAASGSGSDILVPAQEQNSSKDSKNK